MNLITESGTMTTTIVANEDKNKVFEICRDCSDGNCTEGEEAVLLTLYPTTKEVQRVDLSTMHMVNHLEKLGLEKVHFLYLLSKVWVMMNLNTVLKLVQFARSAVKNVM